MSQTRENRMLRHYRALKKSTDYRRESVGSVWMQLARTWRMPIREVKDIIRDEKEKP